MKPLFLNRLTQCYKVSISRIEIINLLLNFVKKAIKAKKPYFILVDFAKLSIFNRFMNFLFSSFTLCRISVKIAQKNVTNLTNSVLIEEKILREIKSKYILITY